MVILLFKLQSDTASKQATSNQNRFQKMSWSPNYLNFNIRPSQDASRMAGFEDSYRRCVWLRKYPEFKSTSPVEHYLNLRASHGQEVANRVFGIVPDIIPRRFCESLLPRNDRPPLTLAQPRLVVAQPPAMSSKSRPIILGESRAPQVCIRTPEDDIADAVLPEVLTTWWVCDLATARRRRVILPDTILVKRIITGEEFLEEPEVLTTGLVHDIVRGCRRRIIAPDTIPVKRIITGEQYLQETEMLKDEEIYG